MSRNRIDIDRVAELAWLGCIGSLTLAMLAIAYRVMFG